ncbi:MAG: Uma2 family endonuclease [Cyanobacteria bacterium J06555_13]
MVVSYPIRPIAKEPETRVLLEGVSWETFERLLEETGKQGHKQLAYSDGCLEIMVPLRDHEEPTRLFDAFVAAIVDELEIELCTLGSLTMKNPDERKGLEPDCCFYIQNESAIRNVETLDFAIHPPPDLVVEVDNTSQSLDKFPIYVALKIPEIWRLRKGKLTLYWLNEAKNDYVEQTESLSFPGIPVAEIPEFIAKAKVNGQRTAVRGFQQRVAQMLTDKSPD